MIGADLARELEALPQVMQLADSFFSTGAGDGKVRYAVELALEELFTNMIKYNAEGGGSIRIELELVNGEVVIRLSDFDSPHFDPFRDAPPFRPGQSLEDRRPGGLGLHLVREMMDRIEYSHHNRTSTITLAKRVV